MKRFSRLSAVYLLLTWKLQISTQDSHHQSGECETPAGTQGRCVRPSECDSVDMFQRFPTYHCETDSWFGVCCPLENGNVSTTTTSPERSIDRARKYPARCTADMMRPIWRTEDLDISNLITPADSLFAHRQLHSAIEIPGPPLQTRDFNMARKMRMRDPPRFRGLNPMITPGMFEGDIVGDWSELSQELRHISSKSTIGDPSKRSERLWPGAVVPYAISSAFTKEERAVIARAFLEFQKVSCVRFVPRTKQKDYIFIAPHKGCYSHVGRQGGKQILSLGPGCVFVGTIEHELMHVLGFWHEQSRIDRDRFIKIVYENIMPNACHNFIRHHFRKSHLLHVPYDLGSVMHYGAYDFSKNGQPTILVRKRRQFRVDKNMGQRKGLSKIDAEKLNILYNCRN